MRDYLMVLIGAVMLASVVLPTFAGGGGSYCDAKCGDEVISSKFCADGTKCCRALNCEFGIAETVCCAGGQTCITYTIDGAASAYCLTE